jgi:phosphoglycerate dehydrogenase-like enzyme
MADHAPCIVVADPISEAAIARLRQHGRVVQFSSQNRLMLREALADAVALVVRTHTRVTADLIAAAPKLRVIGRSGVGLDTIDVAAAQKRGITVVYTPAASTQSVAEQAFALMLAVERRLLEADAAVRDGRFHSWRSAARFRELGETTLGIVGMGRIGSRVGRIGQLGFSMRVLYNDIAEVGPFEFPATACPKDRLFREADVVTMHVPLTDQTRGLVNAGTLALFRPSTLLINTSRGAVVDGVALANVLAAGRLGGAGLDVFESEPLPAGHPLLTAPRTVFSPHAAARSASGLARMDDVVDDVIAVLDGRRPRFPAEDLPDSPTADLRNVGELG